jgi:nucleotide-binding universal stress UspA family protein
MFKMILLALDESEEARRAVDITLDLAKRYGAEVVVEHIWEDVVMVAALASGATVPSGSVPEARGVELVEVEGKRLRKAGVTVRAEVRGGAGQVGDQIVAAAREARADLTIMGSRGLSDPGALIVGSASHRVLQLASCPVMIVR